MFESNLMFVYIIVRMLDDNFMALVLIATLFYLISSFGCQLTSINSLGHRPRTGGDLGMINET